MTERTNWYPGTVKPKRIGLYERNIKFWHTKIRWSFWNGRFWGGWAGSKAFAVANQNYRSTTQEAPWRGLAAKPR